MKTHLEWTQLFIKHLKEYLGDRLLSAVLYGSVAQGTEKPDSDIDLLLVIKDITKGAYQRRIFMDKFYQAWEKDYGPAAPPFFSTILKSPEEAKKLSPIYFDMTDRKQILFDQDCFMQNIIDDVKARLKRLGAKRKYLGKIEYWDLKPDYKPGEVFEI